MYYIADDDQFEGPKFHTALWKKNVEIKNKKVAVIGTGASAVQTVPNIAQDVKELYVFQRTPGWIPPRDDFKYPVIIRVSVFLNSKNWGTHNLCGVFSEHC